MTRDDEVVGRRLVCARVIYDLATRVIELLQFQARCDKVMKGCDEVTGLRESDR